MMDNVVITGCGWVTPFAAGNIGDVLAAAAKASAPKGADYWPIPDELLLATPGVAAECRQDPGAHLSAVALEYARKDAALAPSAFPGERVGMVLGCALAGQSGMIDFANDVREQSARFVSPIRFPQTVGNSIAGALARAYDIRGPNSTLASGVASGLAAILEACAILRSQRADLVYAGGVDRLTPGLALGLSAHRSQSDAPAVFSDGACWFVMEREDDARRRGASAQAMVANDDHFDATSAMMTCAGWQSPGAVAIEQWVGRCMGALGAAAVAAGIGAMRGQPAPYVPPEGGSRTASAARALVALADHESRRTSVGFSFPV